MNANINQIDKYIFISDLEAAESSTVIKHYKIKHILTANIHPLSKILVDNYTWVDAEDLPKQDLISYFPATYRFIDNGVTRKENVLVHCIAGMSRSASIVIAYLMKKKHIPVEECIEKVRRERSIVDPNVGFRRQLKLYEDMGHEIDILNRDYRLIALIELINRLSRATHAYAPVTPVTADVVLTRYFSKLARTKNLYEPQTNYRCKKCRAMLFNDIHVISDQSEVCTSIYIEPQTWMRASLSEFTIYEIKCPHCAKRIGGYDFAGINCDPNCTKHGGSFEQYFKVNANDIDITRLNMPSPQKSMPKFYADESKKW